MGWSSAKAWTAWRDDVARGGTGRASDRTGVADEGRRKVRRRPGSELSSRGDLAPAGLPSLQEVVDLPELEGPRLVIVHCVRWVSEE